MGGAAARRREAPSTAGGGHPSSLFISRKTTLDKETLYFGELYERVSAKKGPAKIEHRYYVNSPERVIAVVTRGGATPGTVYVHADNIGSVEKLTNENGDVVGQRSYDVYGQRRNPVWGQPPPASFSSKTTLAFTGHESDDEVGLVNMRGRVFDPKVGRFLTTDPIVSDLYFGQSFNPYSYVLGNPLTLVDPSGFQPSTDAADEPGVMVFPEAHITAGSSSQLARYLHHEGPPPREDPPPGPKEKEDARQAGEVGAAAPPTDVDTTGSSPEMDTQAATTASEDWTQNPYIQIEGGFLAGVSLGVVPGAAVGQQLLDAGEVLPHGTPEARFGLAVGQIVGGLATMAGGFGGEVLGGAATSTGIGAAVGVPAIVVSTTLVVGGVGNVAAGIRGLMTTGSGTPKTYPPDKTSKNTVYRSARYKSERDARSFARTALGRKPVQVEPGKLRSADGRWQYRGKLEDLEGHRPGDTPHVHLERLDPDTGEVLENWHLRW